MLTLLQQVIYVAFTGEQNLWDRGRFAQMSENKTMLPNPWNETKNVNAPFDQRFYLILNVAVGSRNGWFKYAPTPLEVDPPDHSPRISR